VLKVQGGEQKPKRIRLVPPYLEVSGHRIPVDILLLAIGFVLFFFNQQIAAYTSTDAFFLKEIGEVVLAVGAVVLIFGRIEFKK
jgi:hypothetical protein